MRSSSALRLIALGALVALGSCSAPVNTPIEYIGASPQMRDANLRGCKLAVTEISDSRLDPTTIGSLGPRVVHGPDDAAAWLRNVLGSLANYGVDISFSPSNAVPKDELTASVTLVTLWVAGITTAKTVGMVVNVRYDRDGAAIKQMNYRGTNSLPNWFNSSDEIQSMITDSAGEIVGAISKDLSALCMHAAS